MATDTDAPSPLTSPSETSPEKAGLPARTRTIALWSGAAGLGLLDLLALDDLLTNPVGGGSLELAFLVASVPALVTLLAFVRDRHGESDPPGEDG